MTDPTTQAVGPVLSDAVAVVQCVLSTQRFALSDILDEHGIAEVGIVDSGIELTVGDGEFAAETDEENDMEEEDGEEEDEDFDEEERYDEREQYAEEEAIEDQDVVEAERYVIEEEVVAQRGFIDEGSIPEEEEEEEDVEQEGAVEDEEDFTVEQDIVVAEDANIAQGYFPATAPAEFQDGDSSWLETPASVYDLSTESDSNDSQGLVTPLSSAATPEVIQHVSARSSHAASRPRLRPMDVYRVVEVDPYLSLLQNTVSAARRATFPSRGAFDMSALNAALPETADDNDAAAESYRFRSTSQIERDKRIGAAGELFVSTHSQATISCISANLNHPGFRDAIRTAPRVTGVLKRQLAEHNPQIRNDSSGILGYGSLVWTRDSRYHIQR